MVETLLTTRWKNRVLVVTGSVALFAGKDRFLAEVE